MTTMDQIHHIRELFYEQDKNISEIAATTGLNRKTVSKYVDMALTPNSVLLTLLIIRETAGSAFHDQLVLLISRDSGIVTGHFSIPP